MIILKSTSQPKLNMVWVAFPIAEVMSITVTLLLFLRLYRRVIRDIPD